MRESYQDRRSIHSFANPDGTFSPIQTKLPFPRIMPLPLKNIQLTTVRQIMPSFSTEKSLESLKRNVNLSDRRKFWLRQEDMQKGSLILLLHSHLMNIGFLFSTLPMERSTGSSMFETNRTGLMK